MAKKKQALAPPCGTNPGPELSIINLKGTKAYRDWLSGFTKTTHITAATLFRLGMAEMAKKHGYQLPPDK